MKFVTADQRTPEWYQARLGKVTASMVKDMVAYSKRGVKNKETGELEFPELEARKKYRRKLVTERIYGIAGVEDVYINEAMRWGMMNEDIARTQYKLFSGNKVTEEGFCILEITDEKTGELKEVMAGCSTDGLINDDGNLEIKNLTPSNHLYEVVMHNELPDQFKDQVQFQLLVTGRDYSHFVGYDSRAPQGIDLLAVHVERDEDYINFLREELFKFLDEVDKEFGMFLQYLPFAERVCRDCGLVFEDYINVCQTCYSNNIKIVKILIPSKVTLLNNVKKTERAKK